MTQLNPNITTAGATLAKTYRKEGGKMSKNSGISGKRTKDGREPSLNVGRGGGSGMAQNDAEEAREDLIDRHARGFARQVQRRSNAVKKGRGRKD